MKHLAVLLSKEGAIAILKKIGFWGEVHFLTLEDRKC
jgi:hypothetical protein